MLRVVRALARLFVRLIADVKVINREVVPETESFIAAINHLGRLDAVFGVTLTDRDDVILLITDKYAKYAFWRLMIRLVDAVWINRKRADLRALREVQKRLKAGGLLGIAPEGTRSKTASLQPGKPGVAYLAAKTGVPVVPVAITGTEDHAVVKSLLRFKRAKITLRAGPPYHLPPMDHKHRDEYLQTQTDEIMCRIAVLLPEKYRGVYADHPRLKVLLAEQETAVAPSSSLSGPRLRSS